MDQMSVEQQNNQPNTMMPEGSNLLFSVNQKSAYFKQVARSPYFVTKPGNEDARGKD